MLPGFPSPSFTTPRAKCLKGLALAMAVSTVCSSLSLAATVSETPYRIDNGAADFGSGSHVLGSPTDNAIVTWDLTPVNGVLTARAFVDGRLYYDRLSGRGTAGLRIEYKRVTAAGALETVRTSNFSLTGPGGDANLSANQLSLFNESFADRDLFTVVVSTLDFLGRQTNEEFIVDSTDRNWSFSPRINNGQTDFGTGGHSLGAPEGNAFVGFFRRLPDVGLTPSTPLGHMLGVVRGTLYWDDLFGGGTARIIIDFQNASGTNLATRTRDLSGTGGNANNGSNQRAIEETFAHPSLFQTRVRVGRVSNGVFTASTTRTFRISSASAGTFQLAPATSRVSNGELFNVALTWTVPPSASWTDLRTVRLRLRDGQDTILSLLFDEATRTFALVNDKDGRAGTAVTAGSKARLQTPFAVLHMENTGFVGSGPTGPSVTLNLAMSFKPKAAGRSFRIEVGAADDQGNEDAFTPAGSVVVAEK